MQKFDTPAPISAVLDIPAGRIQFIAADRADTTVEVLPANASKGRDVKVAEQTKVDYRDGVLRIESSAKNQFLGPPGSVEVTVQLPAGSRVEAKAASAEFRAVGRLGDVAFDGAYGLGQARRGRERPPHRRRRRRRGRPPGRPRGDQHPRGDIQIAEAVRGTVVLTHPAGDDLGGAAAGVSASLDAGTRYGRISNALKNDGAADLNIHATTAHGDITARSL